MENRAEQTVAEPVKSAEYARLDLQLQGRNKSSRKLDNNTYAERRGEDIAIRLHQTDILTYKKDGTIVANSGGWKTTTTKDRLNNYLPSGWSVSQRKGLWYWRNWDQDDVLFTDGDYIKNGIVHSQATNGAEKNQKALRKQINTFATLAASKLPLPYPSGGDCWHCYFKGEDGKSMGDLFKDKDHLMSHMKEGYVVPSLVYTALKEAGNSDFVIGMAFNGGATPKGWETLASERVKKAVNRFMRRRLGLA